MVTLAFVLFTVSTLASLTNAFPQEQPVVRHECGDKTFCHIKPADYPQEKIDRLALKHLPLLRRMRRQLTSKVADPEYGGNCYPKITNITFFTMRDNNGPKYLINSKWFAQNITQVECTEDQEQNSSCFKEYLVSSNVQTKCETRKVAVQLFAYTPGSEKLEPVNTEIGTDCACVIQKS